MLDIKTIRVLLFIIGFLFIVGGMYLLTKELPVIAMIVAGLLCFVVGNYSREND